MLASIDEAMAYTGHKSRSTFRGYICRMNKALPADNRVVRVGGRIDMDSLKVALKTYSGILDVRRNFGVQQ